MTETLYYYLLKEIRTALWMLMDNKSLIWGQIGWSCHIILSPKAPLASLWERDIGLYVVSQTGQVTLTALLLGRVRQSAQMLEIRKKDIPLH